MEKMIIFYSASLSFEKSSDRVPFWAGSLPQFSCSGSAFWWEYCVLSLASVSKRLFDFSMIIFCPKTMKHLLLSSFFPRRILPPSSPEKENVKLLRNSYLVSRGNKTLWQLSPADWKSLNPCLPTQSSDVFYFLTWAYPFVKLFFVCVDEIVPAAVCNDKNLQQEQKTEAR